MIRRKAITHRLWIAWPRARFLMDERVHPRQNRRSERSSAGGGPSAGCSRAGRASVGRIGVAEHVKMRPQPVRRKKRNVGNVAHAVVWITTHYLPRRLGITGA